MGSIPPERTDEAGPDHRIVRQGRVLAIGQALSDLVAARDRRSGLVAREPSLMSIVAPTIACLDGEPPNKHCRQCGKLFYRSIHYSAKQWAAVRFCSRTCYDAERRAVPAGATKACEGCGRTFIKQQRGGRGDDWTKQRFCSRACYEAGRKAVPAGETQVCRGCGHDYARQQGESRANWRNRRFCSRACADAERQAKAKSKPTGAVHNCEECGQAFTKKKKDSATQWLNRRFCSPSCGMVARWKVIFAARPDIEAVFWGHVQKTPTCWLWRGGRTRGGYGRFQYAGKRYRAHVFALALDGRPVPKGRGGLHHCDTPHCVRPSHLYVGTQKMNGVDTWNRIRTDYGVQHRFAKLTSEAVLEMRRQRLQGVAFARIARSFNVAYGTARNAILGRTWKHSVPFNADDLARLNQVSARMKRP